jgi:hypothetical protein
MPRDDRRVDRVNRVVAVHIERATDTFDIVLHLQRIEARVTRTRDKRRARDPERVAREHETVVHRVRPAVVERTGRGIRG